MATPRFTEDQDDGPRSSVLIVDKVGLIGAQLCRKLATEFHVVFVSSVTPQNSPHVTSISLDPDRKQVKELPDKRYLALFVVDNGEVEVKDMLSVFVKKAEKDNAKLILITSIYRYNEQFTQEFCQQYKKACVLVYGDVFGAPTNKPMKVAEDTLVQQFLWDAARNEQVVVEDSGIAAMHPVALSDVVRGAIAVLFHSDAAQVFSAVPVPMTQLTLARLLTKHNPLLQIRFRQKKGKKKAIQVPEAAVSVLIDPYPTTKRFSRALDAMQIEAKKDGGVVPNETGERGSVIRKRSGFMVVFLLALLFLPFFTTVISGAVGGILLMQAKNSLVQGENTAVTQANQASALFRFATFPFRILRGELVVFGQERLSTALGATLEQGEQLGMLVGAVARAKQAFAAVGSGDSLAPEEEFSQGVQSLKTAVTTIQALESAPQAGLLPVDKEELQRVGGVVKRVSGIIDVLPELVGMRKKQTYLVLFQNNMELRPGGGFIGSYGILEIEKGSVLSFAIYDVYDADGQMKGHVEPPFVLRRHIPVVHWFLRDSNMTLDYPTNAKQAAFFLKEEVGTVVDGVIALDLSFVRELLSITGPLYLPDYDDTVSADTLFAKAEEETGEQFFDGSLTKKNFLRSTATALQDKLDQGKGFSYVALGTMLDAAITEKHLMFAFSNQTTQRLFALANMTGSLGTQEAVNADVHDFLAVSDTNVGVNKANYKVRRVIKKETVIQNDGSILSDVAIGYTNTSEGALGGDYKNYLQLYLPAGSILRGVEINGVKQTVIDAVTDFTKYERKGFVAPKGLEIERSEILGKTVYGFLVSVPKGSSTVVRVSYGLPQKLDLTKPTVYEHLFFKQPGTQRDPFSFALAHPTTLRAEEKTSAPPLSFTTKAGRVEAQGELSTDTSFRISFTNK